MKKMAGKLTDSHCHLHMDHYRKDRRKVIERARREGVALMITIGTDLEDSQKALKLAEEEPDIFCTVGFHPHGAGRVTERDMEALEELAKGEKVIAIGETGLDYYRDLSPREIQRKVFMEQLELARSLGKPVVIHCRDAYRDLIRLMVDKRAQEVGGVIHCFSGDWETAQTFLNIGFFLSFAGNITYPKAEKLREVFKKAPKDRLLMETDAPFLTPQEERGKRNEPAFIRYTYQLGSELKGIKLEDWIDQVNNNVHEAFPQLPNPHYNKRLS